MGEGVCTKGCQEECPPGWTCKAVAGTEPDLVFVCVSDFTNLCRPCEDGNDCKSLVGAEDVCVDYGPDGNFCGGACETNDDCPWGFSCDDVETVDGIETKQCVNDGGDCPCTTKAVDLALWTPCESTSKIQGQTLTYFLFPGPESGPPRPLALPLGHLRPALR